MLSHLLLFAEFSGLYPIILLESVQTGISHDEGQRFPHTEFNVFKLVTQVCSVD